VVDTLVTGVIQSIYRYASTRWLAWITPSIDVVRSSVVQDAFDRRYWTGDGAPKMGVATTILSGTSKPGGSTPLGIPAPAGVPVLSAPPGDGSVDDVTYAYTYTFVSLYGEEGPPCVPGGGAALPTVTSKPISATNACTITGLSAGGVNIGWKNLYRMNMGSTSAALQFVKSISSVTSTATDTMPDADLGELLPSATWVAPNAEMTGLISHPGGFLVGFYKNIVCFSEPYVPHAWPAVYQIPVEGTIIAIGVFGNSILVTTTSLPYVITGTTPGALSYERLETGEACQLRRGFVDMGDACMYPGVSGLWSVGTGSAELATISLFAKKEFAAYLATLQFASHYETCYIGFMTSGGFVFDTETGDFSTHDITATAAWHDTETGKLFIVVAGVVKEWAGGTNKSLAWKSKLFQVEAPTNFGAGQIFAAGAMTVKVYADGVIRNGANGQVVTSSTPFRLPGGFLATNWEVQVEGAYEVTSVLLASTMSELAQV
jgi:hypothetical protein